MRLLLLIRCAVSSKKQMTFLSGEKVTFVKWQERSWKNKSSKIMIFEKENNKTTALSSLRTAQSGKSETRQNEKGTINPKRSYLSVDKYSDQSLMWIL